MLFQSASPPFNDVPQIISSQDLGQHLKITAKAIATAICAAYVAGLFFGEAIHKASDALASSWRFLLVPDASADDCSSNNGAQPQPQPAPCRTTPSLTAADQEWDVIVYYCPEPVASRDFLIPLI